MDNYLKINDIKNSKSYKKVFDLKEENLTILNDEQLNIIYEIARFCEENDKFPTEKQMRVKDGYPSRPYIIKTLKLNTFPDIYEYIFKYDETPKERKCSKCKETKPLTIEYYSEHKHAKYGFKTMCKTCDNNYRIILNYRHKGIPLKESVYELSVEEWWELFHDKVILVLPEHCYKDENLIKIVRYALLEKFKLNKNQILQLNVDIDFHKYRLFNIYRIFNTKENLIRTCFPEYNLKSYELSTKSFKNKEDVSNAITEWLNDNNYTLDDILNGTYEFNSIMNSIINRVVTSKYKLFIWYFNEVSDKNYNISEFDFKIKPDHFWDDSNNRRSAIIRHCEKYNIQLAIKNNNLKDWTYNHFKQEDIGAIFGYSNYYNSLYEVLIDAYPIIKEKNLLFEWEWRQISAKKDKSFFIKALRELILIRENLTNPLDISRYLRYANLIKRGYIKFVKRVQRGMFASLYEWANLSFPEYKNQWTESDFNDFYAFDGTVCDSLEEVEIYEFLKRDCGLNINYISNKWKYRTIFNVDEQFKHWYVPDFSIEINGNTVFIEYFGMFDEKDRPNNKVITTYRNKTFNKIKYYTNNNIECIYLYPKDLKDGFKGIINKLKDYGIELIHKSTINSIID